VIVQITYPIIFKHKQPLLAQRVKPRIRKSPIKAIWDNIIIYYSFDFSSNTGDLTQVLSLAREVLCHLSHTLSPFNFSFFSDRVSHFGPWSLHVWLPSFWDHRLTPPCSVCYLKWGLRVFCCCCFYYSW
jgi:hypothetical protein